ncbi:TraR/DksA C4-type zinc finger protein [Streptomyces sp. NPDC057197]|uniref:TraR/DksA family transcriptional regulator n=1 Tax=Streptomyces sp. NPDC057197 TaxID=3346045 RepID=UPI003644311A
MVAKKTAEQSASDGSRHTGADGRTTGSARSTGAKGAARETATGRAKGRTKAPAEGGTAGDPERTEAAAPRRTPERKAAAHKTPARKAAPAKEPAPGDSPPKSAAQGGSGAAVGRKSSGKKAGAAEAAKQTGATTVVAKKTPGRASRAGTAGTATAAKTAVPKARVAAAVEPGDLAVRPGEDPWTEEEVAEARAELESEMERLSTEISSSEASLAGLMRDSGDGAGDDQADTGTKNITREHELALAANARETLTQTERALDRLDAGTYGVCENCGNPIGKARMQAFPRATLCVECKQKQERR